MVYKFNFHDLSTLDRSQLLELCVKSSRDFTTFTTSQESKDRGRKHDEETKRDNVLIIQIKFTIVGYLHRLIIIQITFIETRMKQEWATTTTRDLKMISQSSSSLVRNRGDLRPSRRLIFIFFYSFNFSGEMIIIFDLMLMMRRVCRIIRINLPRTRFASSSCSHKWHNFNWTFLWHQSRAKSECDHDKIKWVSEKRGENEPFRIIKWEAHVDDNVDDDDDHKRH